MCKWDQARGTVIPIVVKYIYRWPKPSPPSYRCRVLCRRCLGKFTKLCGWYWCYLHYSGNYSCSSDTLRGMSHICWTSWHCIQHNENSMYAGPAKTITRVRLGNEELSFVEEFRYLGDIMTADCRDDKDLKNNSRGKMQWAICWSGNSHLHLLRQKSNCSSHIVTPFIYVLFGVIHSITLLESLLSVIVTHSSVLLTSPDTPAQVWHLRWTQLIISMRCPEICLQLDEQSNSFLQQYCHCHCQ